MAAITRFNKIDTAARTSAASATPAEVTQYTIAWSDLTGAGFANGDVVIILCRQSVLAESANGQGNGEWRRGSTFAGAAVIAGSNYLIEPQSTNTNRGHHHSWFKKVTLATNDNLYFGMGGDGTNTGTSNDLSLLILLLDDLAAGDWRYAEQTHAGNAPTTYDTSGAAVTVPGAASANDWLLITQAHWLIDSTTADVLQAMSWAGSDLGESREEGENTAEIRGYTVHRYVTGITADTTLRARYRSDTSSSHDCDLTQVFALRLSAFRDHAGVQDESTTITHTVLSTFQEYAGLPTYAHGGSGANDLILLGATREGATGDAGKNPIQRIQIGGANVLSSLGAAGGAKNHGTSDAIVNVIFGVTSQTNGTLDIDADVAEEQDINPNPTHTYHTLVAFSAELATLTQTINGAAASAAPAGTTGALSPGLVTLAGVAASAAIAATIGALVVVATMAGAPASAAPAATTGALAVGAATLAGSPAGAGIAATTGAFSPGAATLAGAPASAGAAATIGVLSSVFTIVGSPGSAGPTATTGSLAAGAATLAGSPASANPAATTGALAAGAATLTGSPASAGATATTGTLTPGLVTLAGVPASAGPAATEGVLSSGGLILVGSPASASPAATTGSFAPGAATLSGAAASAAPAATAGTLTPGAVIIAGSAATAGPAATTGALSLPGQPQTLDGAAATAAPAATTGVLTVVTPVFEPADPDYIIVADGRTLNFTADARSETILADRRFL